MTIRPILALQFLAKWTGERIQQYIGFFALFFLTCQYSSARIVLLALPTSTSLWRVDCHSPVYWADCLTLAYPKGLISKSLNSFLWPASKCFHARLSNSNIFGNWFFDMRASSPAQWNCFVIRMVWMLGRLARPSTSEFGILSCHLMLVLKIHQRYVM